MMFFFEVLFSIWILGACVHMFIVIADTVFERIKYSFAWPFLWFSVFLLAMRMDKK